jgi:hypothetical protein
MLKIGLSVLAFAIVALSIDLSPLALAVATSSMAVNLGIKVSVLDCVVLMQAVALLANLLVSVGGWACEKQPSFCC